MGQLNPDALQDLHDALKDCVKRLRRCAALHGNADWAVDALCEPFETALAKAGSGGEER